MPEQPPHPHLRCLPAAVLVESPKEPRREVGPCVKKPAVLGAVRHHVGEVKKAATSPLLAPPVRQIRPQGVRAAGVVREKARLHYPDERRKKNYGKHHRQVPLFRRDGEFPYGLPPERPVAEAGPQFVAARQVQEEGHAVVTGGASQLDPLRKRVRVVAVADPPAL